MQTPEVMASTIAVAASLVDLRTRRIPNMLTYTAVLAALAYHSHALGWAGLRLAMMGCLVGLALFLPVYLLRGMGAGDLKLLAALGAWLGPWRAVWVALYGAVAGGALGLFLALATGYAPRLLSNVWLLLAHWRVAGLRPLDDLSLEHGTGPRLAYAVPITVGLVCTLAWR